MPTTDTNVPQVVVNKLTKAQYEAATKEPTEFYMVTDEQIETSDIADGAVTATKIDFTTLPISIFPAITGTNQQIQATLLNGGLAVALSGLITINAASATFALANGVPAPKVNMRFPMTGINTSDSPVASGFMLIDTSGNVTVKMTAAVTYATVSGTYSTV